MDKKRLHLFVDNSNVLLEGRRFSMAKKLGRKQPGSQLDQSYEIDWGKFLYLVKEQDTRILSEVPYLYGSRPPPNDSVWDRIREDGFDAKVFDRNIRNKEKGVDMHLGLDVSERIHTCHEPAVIVIVAGDADYVPVVERSQEKGWEVEVWFWSNAASDLKKACDRFCELNRQLEYIRMGSSLPFPA